MGKKSAYDLSIYSEQYKLELACGSHVFLKGDLQSAADPAPSFKHPVDQDFSYCHLSEKFNITFSLPF